MSKQDRIKQIRARRNMVVGSRKRLRVVEAHYTKVISVLNRRLKRLLTPPVSDGQKAANYLLKYAGQTESPPASNNSPFLRAWEDGLPHDRLDWMIPGNPWCGFACLAAWYYGAGKLLPDGVVYTPNIVAWAHSGQGFRGVRAEDAQAGDLVVFNFPGGNGVADHVGLALGPAHQGSIETVEGNTSSSSGGSQSNGGGVFKRIRPLSQVAVIARPK